MTTEELHAPIKAQTREETSSSLESMPKTMSRVASRARGKTTPNWFLMAISSSFELPFNQIRYSLSCFVKVFPMTPHMPHLEVNCENGFSHTLKCEIIFLELMGLKIEARIYHMTHFKMNRTILTFRSVFGKQY